MYLNMSLKRRRFIQALATAPAASALAQQRGAGQPAATPQAARAATTRKLATAEIDAQAETAPHFFNAEQFAALRKLGSLFMPPRKGHPGALDAGAPEFIDFLIGVSPAAQKKLYLDGLDALNARARSRFRKSFASLDDTQADVILRPLVVTIAWVLDRPADPLQHFVAQAHDDLRTATVNSLEWANAAAAQDAGRRRGSNVGLYIRPIDPIYRG